MSDVYMDDSVHLSNKACRLRYINVGPAKHEPGGAGGCQCPKGRCWYNEQQTRREHGLQAMTSQSWLTPEDLGATGEVVDVSVPECVEQWRGYGRKQLVSWLRAMSNGADDKGLAADSLEWLATAPLEALRTDATIPDWVGSAFDLIRQDVERFPYQAPEYRDALITRMGDTARRALARLEATDDDAVQRFAREILHGDKSHRAWLLDAAERFSCGRPIPAPTRSPDAIPLPDVLPLLRAMLYNDLDDPDEVREIDALVRDLMTKHPRLSDEVER